MAEKKTFFWEKEKLNYKKNNKMAEKEDFGKLSDSISEYDNIGKHELMLGYRKLQHLSVRGFRI